MTLIEELERTLAIKKNKNRKRSVASPESDVLSTMAKFVDWLQSRGVQRLDGVGALHPTGLQFHQSSLLQANQYLDTYYRAEEGHSSWTSRPFPKRVTFSSLEALADTILSAPVANLKHFLSAFDVPIGGQKARLQEKVRAIRAIVQLGDCDPADRRRAFVTEAPVGNKRVRPCGACGSDWLDHVCCDKVWSVWEASEGELIATWGRSTFHDEEEHDEEAPPPRSVDLPSHTLPGWLREVPRVVSAAEALHLAPIRTPVSVRQACFPSHPSLPGISELFSTLL